MRQERSETQLALDTQHKEIHLCRELKDFRTSFWSALIAFAMLFGFVQKGLGTCCGDDGANVSAQSAGAVMEQQQSGDNDPALLDHCCVCLCHQHIAKAAPGSPNLINLAPLTSVIPPLTLTPPDVEPTGIEYPPQLA